MDNEKRINYRGRQTERWPGCSSAMLEGLQTWTIRINFYEEIVPGANWQLTSAARTPDAEAADLLCLPKDALWPSWTTGVAHSHYPLQSITLD